MGSGASWLACDVCGDTVAAASHGSRCHIARRVRGLARRLDRLDVFRSEARVHAGTKAAVDLRATHRAAGEETGLVQFPEQAAGSVALGAPRYLAQAARGEEDGADHCCEAAESAASEPDGVAAGAGNRAEKRIALAQHDGIRGAEDRAAGTQASEALRAPARRESRARAGATVARCAADCVRAAACTRDGRS